MMIQDQHYMGGGGGGGGLSDDDYHDRDSKAQEDAEDALTIIMT